MPDSHHSPPPPEWWDLPRLANAVVCGAAKPGNLSPDDSRYWDAMAAEVAARPDARWFVFVDDVPGPWCPACGDLPDGTDEADHHGDVHGCDTLRVEREVEAAVREREAGR